MRKRFTKKVKAALVKLPLEDLRWRRDLAKHDGDFELAFECAVAIDKKKGYYK